MDELATIRLSRVAPVLRVRIKHERTVREGWRLSETTVEIEMPITAASEGECELEARTALHEAYEIGMREAARRNTAEGR